jgi:hypothetical protein
MKPVLPALLTLIVMCGPAAEEPEPVQLSGPYLGQTLPGAEPEIFAPGIVSTGMYERDIAIAPDGNTVYFCVMTSNFGHSTIMEMRQETGQWTMPETASFSGSPDHNDLEPCIAPDGSKFYFVSNRPGTEGGESDDLNIWCMDRVENGWGAPYVLGDIINTERNETFPSVTNDGTLYFTRAKPDRSEDIVRSRLVNGAYTEPETLGPEVNSANQFNAFVSPDESYVIVCVVGREDSKGSIDYYACFRNADDSWSGPVNLGDAVNTASGLEYSPHVSRDGRYFFFMSSRMSEPDSDTMQYQNYQRNHNRPGNGQPDIWWMDASFIQSLRPTGSTN